MIRPTSKAALSHLTETGKIGERQAAILQYIYYNPGCTRLEIARYNMQLKINTVSGRTNELIKKLFVFENGCKKDPDTGRSANCLYVTKDGREFIESVLEQSAA